MAEGFEPYHVPLQSRRDKLRIVAQNHSSLDQGGAAGNFFPIYDPSLLSSDFLSSAANPSPHNPPICVVKEENRVNFMGFVGGISTNSTPNHHFLDPQSSLHINPNQFLYAPQNPRDFEPHGGEVVVFRPESSMNGQGLSLSLSSHDSHHHDHHHQNNLPLELNLPRYGCGYIVPGNVAGASASIEVSRSSVPLGPFTGYASILKGSRFLKPAQNLLEELCEFGGEICAEKFAPDPFLVESLSSSNRIMDDPFGGSSDGGDNKREKSRLLSMLDEVYRRYKLYYQQMQAVLASFECVPGLGNAAPFANLAVRAMSKQFTSLKNAITDQLQFNKTHSPRNDNEGLRIGNSADKSPYSSRAIHNSRYPESHPVWRPQRGLPERAVTVLRAWLFEHFLHPYPTDTDKLMLARQTGLSRSQVSNWFINARVRLWKPMVEEIHSLETRQAQKASQKEDRNASKFSDHATSMSPHASENPSTSTRRVETPSKRTRNDLPDIPSGNEPHNNMSYNMSSHQQVGNSMAGGSSGVSLTLGLHQNNGVGLSEPYPINAAQRYGLGVEVSNEGYVMGGFEAHNRHFGRDFMGGQFLHDFVG